ESIGSRMNDSILDCLTKSERLVIDKLKLGLSNKEIADQLFICDTTVRFHLKNIYKKLKVKNRLQFLVKTHISAPSKIANDIEITSQTLINGEQNSEPII